MDINQEVTIRWSHDGRRADGSTIPADVPRTFVIEFNNGTQRVQYPPVGEPALAEMQTTLTPSAIGLSEGNWSLGVRAYLDYEGQGVASALGDGGPFPLRAYLAPNPPHGIEYYAE